MNIEALIKGKLVNQIVFLMLEEAGYLVLPYNENISISLLQTGTPKNDEVAKRFRSSPSFIVINKKDSSTTLIHVKYQGLETSGRNIDWGYGKMKEYWPEANLLIARPKKPYFYAVLETENGLKAVPLKDSGLFMIKEDQVLKFGKFIKKFMS